MIIGESDPRGEYCIGCLGKDWKRFLQMVAGFQIQKLLFAALVADPEKLCMLVSEFGRVCERITLQVNVGKSKVIRCSRYGNMRLML